jgi:hypothetical protein
MIRSLNHPDLISGPHISLDDYAQIRAGSHGLSEAARKHLIVHPNSKPPAGYPRLGDLEKSSPDLPTVAYKRIVQVEAFGSEVLPKLAVCKGSAHVLFPPSYVFDGVCVDRFIGSPVCLAIRLLVSLEIYTSGCDPTGGR